MSEPGRRDRRPRRRAGGRSRLGVAADRCPLVAAGRRPRGGARPGLASRSAVATSIRRRRSCPSASRLHRPAAGARSSAPADEPEGRERDHPLRGGDPRPPRCDQSTAPAQLRGNVTSTPIVQIGQIQNSADAVRRWSRIVVRVPAPPRKAEKASAPLVRTERDRKHIATVRRPQDQLLTDRRRLDRRPTGIVSTLRSAAARARPCDQHRPLSLARERF